MPVSRRCFVVGSLSTFVTLSAGSVCASDRQPPPRHLGPRQHVPSRKQGPLGVALLGLGQYSRGLLAPALQKTQHCALRGVVTGSPHKVPIWQRDYGILDRNVYDYASLPKIADNQDIDVVYIVVPTGLHAKYAVMAAEAGKHVWCEKPMAMNVAECQRIIDACRKNRVKLSIGYRMQHEPNTRTVMGYAQRKPYGPLRGVRAFAGHSGGGPDSGWRLERAMGGGALYDMGVYSINAIRYASGEEPVRVTMARQSTKRPKVFTEVDETTEFELALPSGAAAYGWTSVGESINRLRVDCERGWYELRPMQTYTGVKGRTSDGVMLDKPIENQQAQQMDDDALAILENRPAMVPGEDGLRDIRIVEAIQEASRTQRPVAI